MVLVELWNGARGAAEQKVLRDLEQLVENVPTTDAVWAEARQLARDSRAAGFTCPATDVLIAACARHHGLEILHRDRHFDLLSQVQGRK
jgi:predicted nucleic acid-binding protein